MDCSRCKSGLFREDIIQVQYSNIPKDDEDLVLIMVRCSRCGFINQVTVPFAKVPEQLREGIAQARANEAPVAPQIIVEEKQADPISADELLDFAEFLKNGFQLPSAGGAVTES